MLRRQRGGDYMADDFQRTISLGDILTEATAMIGRNAVLLVLAAAVLAGELFLFDAIARQMGPATQATRLLYALANLPIRTLFDYTIAALLISSERFNPHGWSITTLGSYIALSIISGLGMVFGFILLIVPGLILLLRWSVAGNFAIAQRLGPIASLRASWHATRGSAGAIFGMLVLLGMVSLVGLFAISGHFSGTPTPLTPVMTGVRDVFQGLLGAVGICVNVAIYALLVGAHDRDIGDVFA